MTAGQIEGDGKEKRGEEVNDGGTKRELGRSGGKGKRKGKDTEGRAVKKETEDNGEGFEKRARTERKLRGKASAENREKALGIPSYRF